MYALHGLMHDISGQIPEGPEWQCRGTQSVDQLLCPFVSSHSSQPVLSVVETVMPVAAMTPLMLCMIGDRTNVKDKLLEFLTVQF